jgi:hypothetical protein
MIKGILAIVMITLETLSIGPTPTIGIFVYDLPDVLRKSLPDGKFIVNASHTKWLETHSIRFVPIDFEKNSWADVLPTLNGIFIPGGLEIYFDNEKLFQYKKQVHQVFQIAQDINKIRPYPVFATGFGAQLLFNELVNGEVSVKTVGSAGKSVNLKFYETQNSDFYKTAQDVNAIKAGVYPLNTNYQYSLEDFKNSKTACSDLNLLASAPVADNSSDEFVMFFEHKTMPYYGFIPDIEMIQFNHSDQQFADKSLKSIEASFQLVKFFSRLLNRNPAAKTEADVLALKNGWAFHSSEYPSGEYEDILWR